MSSSRKSKDKMSPFKSINFTTASCGFLFSLVLVILFLVDSAVPIVSVSSSLLSLLSHYEDCSVLFHCTVHLFFT